MVNEQVLRGHWNEVRGKLKERWGQLTDDDLVLAQGNTDQLIGVIQRRTGEAREKIERDLDKLTGEFGSRVEQVKDRAAAAAANVSGKAKDYAQNAGQYVQNAGQYVQGTGKQVSQAAHDTYDDLSARTQAGYADAEQTVRRHPVESLTVAFGTGLIAGVILGLCFKPHD